MDFNTVIDRLRQWCVSKAGAYQKEYAGYGGMAFVGYQVACELEFKLSMLIDRSFENAGALREEILKLLDIHYEPSVIKPKNRAAESIIDRTNREFRGYLEEVLSETGSIVPSDLPYKRVIVCSEAAELIERFRSVWQYENTSYWYPLLGDEPKEIPDKFYIMFDRFEPYRKQMDQIIGLPKAHLYCYGEASFRPEHCIETAELIEYGGCEIIYTDKSFSWAVYFSHEWTVSFAGAIVPKAKELLLKEKSHWNKLEWRQNEE